MKAVAGGMKSKAGGPSKAVAKEFVKADEAKMPKPKLDAGEKHIMQSKHYRDL